MKDVYAAACPIPPLPTSTSSSATAALSHAHPAPGAAGYVHGLAFQDDFNMIGCPDDLIPAFCRLEAKAKEAGLSINHSKCQFLWFHEEQPLSSAVQEFLRKTGIKSCPRVATILGTPVGIDADMIKSEAMKIVDHSKLFFDRILHQDMPMQHAMLLLRVSALPKLSYMLRTLRPGWCMRAATAFDTLIHIDCHQEAQAASHGG